MGFGLVEWVWGSGFGVVQSGTPIRPDNLNPQPGFLFSFIRPVPRRPLQQNRHRLFACRDSVDFMVEAWPLAASRSHATASVFPRSARIGVRNRISRKPSRRRDRRQGPVEFRLDLVQRCLIAGRVIWFYLGKLFYPHPLTFIYPRWKAIDMPTLCNGFFRAAALLSRPLFSTSQQDRPRRGCGMVVLLRDAFSRAGICERLSHAFLVRRRSFS